MPPSSFSDAEEAPTSISTYVARSSFSGAGAGLFAGRTFRPGETVVAYAGKRLSRESLTAATLRRGFIVRGSRGFVDTQDANGRLRLSDGELVNPHRYTGSEWARLRSVGVGWVGLGSLARFANHSDRPNTRLKGLRLVAKKRIPRDAEVTLNYGQAYNTRF